MFDNLNNKINQLQPKIIKQEHKDALPVGSYIPILSDIILPSIAMALLLIVLRNLFDRFIVTPFGAIFGVKEITTKTTVIPNPLLESYYKKRKVPTSDDINILSKKSGMTERQIQFWFRQRKKQDKASGLKRLCDASWSFVFYAILSWYGLYVLWDKSWLRESKYCWIDWPAHPVTNDVYWYYLIEVGFYISYLYMLFTDHKRKDFVEFLIHHSVTVALMILSWSINGVRIGTLVLVIHDQVDWVLALAKTFTYLKKYTLADLSFVVFLPTWIITRLFIYPYIVLYTVYIELPEIAESDPYLKSYDRSVIGHLLKSLLVVLQILHVLWTILILKSAATKFTKGKLQDARSDSEDEGDDEDEINSHNKLQKSNNNVFEVRQ